MIITILSITTVVVLIQYESEEWINDIKNQISLQHFSAEANKFQQVLSFVKTGSPNRHYFMASFQVMFMVKIHPSATYWKITSCLQVPITFLPTSTLRWDLSRNSAAVFLGGNRRCPAAVASSDQRGVSCGVGSTPRCLVYGRLNFSQNSYIS